MIDIYEDGNTVVHLYTNAHEAHQAYRDANMLFKDLGIRLSNLHNNSITFRDGTVYVYLSRDRAREYTRGWRVRKVVDYTRF